MEKDCIFCKIIKGEVPADFVYQDNDVVAFKDINPQAPVHILVVPREHIASVNSLTETNADLIAKVILTGKKVAEKLNIAQTGYKLLFNVERGGGQVIFHLHLHLLGGWKSGPESLYI